jgi:hypothetical protein
MGWIARLFKSEDSQSLRTSPAQAESSTQRSEPTLAGTEAPTRITVGNCSGCGQPLRMKKHAVKAVVRLTCKCGVANEVAVPDEIVNSVDVAAAKDARKPAPYEDPPEVTLLVDSACRLLEIYQLRREGFLRSGGGPLETEIRDIGQRLYQTGGDDLIFRAHNEFRRKCNVPGGPRNLEIMWHGIGEWQG